MQSSFEYQCKLSFRTNNVGRRLELITLDRYVYHCLCFCDDGYFACMHREFPSDLFVLLVPPQSWGVVVNYIQEAIFLEILSWGKIAR
jgi:hypothetical protein